MGDNRICRFDLEPHAYDAARGARTSSAHAPCTCERLKRGDEFFVCVEDELCLIM